MTTIRRSPCASGTAAAPRRGLPVVILLEHRRRSHPLHRVRSPDRSTLRSRLLRTSAGAALFAVAVLIAFGREAAVHDVARRRRSLSDVICCAIGTLHFVATVDGVTKDDELVAPGSDPSCAAERDQARSRRPSDGIVRDWVVTIRRLRRERPIVEPRGVPIFERLAQARASSRMKSVLRCEPRAAHRGGARGPTSAAPMCTAPATCILDLRLRRGDVNWSRTPELADERPRRSELRPTLVRAAVVQVGTGQTDYPLLTDGQTVQMEPGPQGGHHIRSRRAWRTSDNQNTDDLVDSTGELFVVSPDDGGMSSKSDPLKGFCQLYGLRYQSDADGEHHHQFLGKPST